MGRLELNKRNQRDQSRCDIQKCALFFSLPFSINSPPSASVVSLSLSWGHPQILQQHTPFLLFCFLLMTDFPFHICISHFPRSPCIFFFQIVSCCLWSPCKICAETSRQVTLLLWPWTHCQVEMTPGLRCSDLPFSLLSQLQPYLSTQPHFFSSPKIIIPTKGQPQRARGSDRSERGKHVKGKWINKGTVRSKKHRIELKGHSGHISRPIVRRSTLNKCACVIIFFIPHNLSLIHLTCTQQCFPRFHICPAFVTLLQFVGVRLLSQFTLKQTFTLVSVILTVWQV